MNDKMREIIEAADEVLGPMRDPLPIEAINEIRTRRAGDPDIDQLLAHIDGLHHRMERVQFVLGGAGIDFDKDDGV